MSIAAYALVDRLIEMGEPHRSQASGELEVGREALRTATNQMVLLVMGVGVLLPKAARQLIADMADEPTSAAIAQLERHGLEQADVDVAMHSKLPPWHAISEHMFEGFPEGELEWEALRGFEPFFKVLDMTCVKGMAWGAQHLEEFTGALAEERKRHESRVPEPGGPTDIEPFPWPTDSDFWKAVTDIVNDYEGLAEALRGLEE